MYIQLILLFVLTSCSVNKIIVHVETTDNLGLPLNGVSVKMLDPIQCCSSDDQPCSFVTSNNGSLDFTFVEGKAIKSEETKKRVCEMVLSKTGYETLRESFYYCVHGPCAGTQNIKLKFKLLPTKKKN